MNAEEIIRLPVSELAFDVNNPRLAEFDTGDDESELIKVLWEAMDVQELVLSVAASGYFPARAGNRRQGGGQKTS